MVASAGSSARGDNVRRGAHREGSQDISVVVDLLSRLRKGGEGRPKKDLHVQTAKPNLVTDTGLTAHTHTRYPGGKKGGTRALLRLPRAPISPATGPLSNKTYIAFLFSAYAYAPQMEHRIMCGRSAPKLPV